MSSCLPRDEYCKASHTRDAVRAAHWCGVGVVAGAVVRTLHLMFPRFSALYLSEQGRAQEFFFPKCEITLIHTDTMPAQPIPDHAEDYIPRYGSTLGYISLHYVPWHYMALLDHDNTSHVIGSHYTHYTHTWSYVHARMQKTLFNLIYHNYSLSSLDI